MEDDEEEEKEEKAEEEEEKWEKKKQVEQEKKQEEKMEEEAMFRTHQAGKQIGARPIAVERKEEEGPAGGGGAPPRCYNPLARARERRRVRLEEESHCRTSGDVDKGPP